MFVAAAVAGDELRRGMSGMKLPAPAPRTFLLSKLIHHHPEFRTGVVAAREE